MRQLYLSNTWLKRGKEEGDIQNGIKWDISLLCVDKKEHRLFIQNVKVIPG